MFENFIQFLYISYLLKSTGKYDIYYNDLCEYCFKFTSIRSIRTLINVTIDSSQLYSNAEWL